MDYINPNMHADRALKRIAYRPIERGHGETGKRALEALLAMVEETPRAPASGIGE